MQYRTLGKTGLRVSEIGLGTWAFGGQWGNQSDEDSFATLAAAAGAGVNFVDTAAGYGDGRSERVIGEFLRRSGQQMYVATKTPPAPGPWPPSPVCRWQDRYPAAYLRDNVHQRLSSLGTDCLDVLQLHTWTRAWNDDPQPLLVLQKLREEGKLRWIGLSTPEQDQDCVVQLMRDGLVDVVQVIFNLFHQEPLAQLFPVAEETATGVIIRVPLDEGTLTGKYSAAHQFLPDDFRSRYLAGDRLPRTVARVEQIRHDLKALGLEASYSLTELALRFALAPPAVSTVIVGMRNAEQVAINTGVSAKPALSASALKLLARHNWRRGVWYGGKQ